MINFKRQIVATLVIAGTILSSCSMNMTTDVDKEEQSPGSDKEESTQIEHHDIVIVGAGIAGLTSGYFLKDKDVVILEKNPTVGGRTISSRHKEFTYAKGTEYLGEPEDPLSQMIDELKLTPKEIPSPMDAYFDGKSIYYGSDGIERYLINHSKRETYANFANLVSKEYEKYDDIPHLDYDDNAKSLDTISAKQWLVNNNFPDAYIKKYNVTAKGLFGATLDEISALSFIPEAAFDYEGDNGEIAELDSERNLAEEYADAKNDHSGSYSFVKGLTELTNKLGEVLGNKIRLNSTVVSVTNEDGKYLVEYMTKDGKESTMTADKVILAVPAPTALKLAPTVISEDKAELMKQVKYASYATVALFSEAPIFDKAFDLAVPDDYYFTDIYDSTWVERFYDQQKKQKDYIMSVYVAPKVSTDHTLDKIGDQDLLKNVYADLDKVFPSASSKITGYDIERFPYAYPIMSLGAYQRLIELNELNTGSLLLAGDYMIYPTFEGAVQSGYLAAKRIDENANGEKE